MRFLVTGAGGFVGKALCLRLIGLGHEVRGIARGNYPELSRAGVQMVRADLADNPFKYEEYFQQIDGVFHVAAKVDMWGEYDDFYRANVVATENVLRSCKKYGVPRLVYTSSPSVIADGANLFGVDETRPYPGRHQAHYPATKALAERLVIASNSENLLYTCSLRPHLIWGPGDTNLVPTILKKARAGKLVQVGAGENKTDLTFIEDCVEAHILAMHALQDNPEARGKVYFITQGEPVNMWGWINQILDRNGLPRVKKKVPVWLALPLAWCSEKWALIAGGEPALTRFLVCEMSTSHYFSLKRAEKLLGYKPSCTIQEAMEKTFPQNELRKAA